MSECDWKQAEAYLREAERAYTEIGPSGFLALTMVIRPLRRRFDYGERSSRLYKEIMAVAL